MNCEVLLDDPPCIVVEIKLESGSFIWLFGNRDFLCILVLVHRHIVSTFHNCNRCHNTGADDLPGTPCGLEVSQSDALGQVMPALAQVPADVPLHPGH